MSTFEDEIRRAMAGHNDEAPRAEDLLRSLEQAPPRRRLAGWYGPLATKREDFVALLSEIAST